MARIEFRNATIRFVDGYSAAGLINDVAIAAGDTALIVSGFTGILPVGARFTLVGVDQKYTITSTSETSGNTTTINFTPPLAVAAGIPTNASAVTVTGRTLEIKVGDGNCQFTENRNYTYDLDRGLLDSVRKGDEVPIDVSLDFVWEFLTALDGVLTPTISDVLHHRGAAANWISSSSDACEDFCFDIEIENEPPCGDQATEFITLPDFRWEQLPHSLTDAQVSMTGKCNATEALVSRL